MPVEVGRHLNRCPSVFPVAAGHEGRFPIARLAAAAEERPIAPRSLEKREMIAVPDVHVPSPFEAYVGDQPHIFVAYAHADAARVYQILKLLNDHRYRVWYDEGIDPGSEWPEDVAHRLTSCATFIVFISPQAVQSRNVRNEINFALTCQVPFLAVHIEQTELPPGVQLQTGSTQAILLYTMSFDRFTRKLLAFLDPSLVDSMSRTGSVTKESLRRFSVIAPARTVSVETEPVGGEAGTTSTSEEDSATARATYEAAVAAADAAYEVAADAAHAAFMLADYVTGNEFAIYQQACLDADAVREAAIAKALETYLAAGGVLEGTLSAPEAARRDIRAESEDALRAAKVTYDAAVAAARERWTNTLIQLGIQYDRPYPQEPLCGAHRDAWNAARDIWSQETREAAVAYQQAEASAQAAYIAAGGWP